MIDTNIFLEAMLSRNRAQECIELLKMLKDGKRDFKRCLRKALEMLRL